MTTRPTPPEGYKTWLDYCIGATGDVLEHLGIAAKGDGFLEGYARAELAELRAEIERLTSGHCKDCCCARAWKALGITEHTGRSIPEEIERLRADLSSTITALGLLIAKSDEEIARLRAALEQIDRHLDRDTGLGRLDAHKVAKAALRDEEKP